MNSSVSTDWQNSCSTIQKANLKLLSSKKFSDVVFLVGEKRVELHAHKLILMSRSSVFETMFERWETEKNCQVEVPEISHRSFQLFLHYLYSNSFSVTGDDAVEVLYLAHKYNTKDLAKLCSDHLKSGIDISNVVRIHQVASRLDQGELRAQAMEFILKNGNAVFEDVGFFEIDFETLATILHDDRLAVDELTVFRAAVRWAENKCNVQKLTCTGQNKRAVLKEIVHLIRFPLMRTQDFTDEVVGKNQGILSDSETIGIYMYFTTNGVSNTTLPALAFNKNKRAQAETYKAEVYEPSKLGLVHSFSRLNYAYDAYTYGSVVYAYQCESTIMFQSSRNICVKAIDLNELSTLGLDQCQPQPGFNRGPVRDNSVVVSVSILPTPLTALERNRIKKSGVILRGHNQPVNGVAHPPAQLHIENLLKTSSMKIEFDSGVDIFNDTRYTIKIKYAINGGGSVGGNSSVVRAHQDKSVRTTCGSENVTLTFTSGRTQCGCRNLCGGYHVQDSSQNCICSDLMKTIHFTLGN